MPEKANEHAPSTEQSGQAETTAGTPSPTALPAVEECACRKCLEQIEANLHAYVITDPDCPSKVRDWVAAANCGARKALATPCHPARLADLWALQLLDQLRAELAEALDALDILLRFGGTGTYDEGVAKARAVLRKHRPPAPDSTPPRRDELDGDVPNPRQSEQEGAKGPSLLALVSKCCGADFELYSEDGTCHYICAACEKACDIQENSHE